MEDCIFCKIVKGEVKSWRVYEDENVYAFFDIHPANKYHTLVIPKKHYQDIFDIPKEELGQVMSVVKELANLYEDKLGIKNVQIINSSGTEAQQDVFHIHFHLVPRNKGDNQDIKWSTHPELVTEYDKMLNDLKNQK